METAGAVTNGTESVIPGYANEGQCSPSLSEAQAPVLLDWGWADFYSALAAVEGDDGGVGSAGERGPFQITKTYWEDANVPWPYMDAVHDYDKSSYAVRRYAWRYESQAAAAQSFYTLARLHNGGPGWRWGSGPSMVRVHDYAARVLNLMRAKQ